jgi:hypothetical protein
VRGRMGSNGNGNESRTETAPPSPSQPLITSSSTHYSPTQALDPSERIQ